jgi:hypothetical protein
MGRRLVGATGIEQRMQHKLSNIHMDVGANTKHQESLTDHDEKSK